MYAEKLICLNIKIHHSNLKIRKYIIIQNFSGMWSNMYIDYHSDNFSIKQIIFHDPYLLKLKGQIYPGTKLLCWIIIYNNKYFILYLHSFRFYQQRNVFLTNFCLQKNLPLIYLTEHRVRFVSLCKFQISYVRHVISLEMYAAFLGEVCAQTHAKYLYVLLLAQVTFKSLSWPMQQKSYQNLTEKFYFKLYSELAGTLPKNI